MSRSASVLRDPAEKPFVTTTVYNGTASPANNTNRLGLPTKYSAESTQRRSTSPKGNKQTLATIANSTHRSPTNYNPTTQLGESFQQRPNGMSHRNANSLSSFNGENLYATSELNDNYETIPQAQLQSKRSSNRTFKPHKTSTSRKSQVQPNFDQTSDSDYASNIHKAASLPDFHQSHLIAEDQSQHAVTDIDDLVRSSSADNLFTPAPDIPPVVKQALVDELKTVFGANGRKERVEKASEYHKRRPPLKNSMRGLRYYDPHYSEQLSRQNSSARGQKSLGPIGDNEAEVLHPLHWNPDEVGEWLDQEGFEDMTSTFRSRNIDGRDLGTLSRKDLKTLGICNPHDIEALNDAIDALFTEDNPRSGNNRRRKPSSRRSLKRRLYSSRHDDTENRPGNSFKGGRGNIRQRNTKIMKAKVPSFSRPGSELIRRQSLIAEQQRQQMPARHQNAKPSELEDPVIASRTSNVAEKARWFNSNATNTSDAKPKRTSSRKNSPELDNKSGVSRVQSLRHDLEVQESHRKLENIFNRKRFSKESLQRKENNGALFATDVDEVDAGDLDHEEIAPVLRMREITVRCEAPQSGGGEGETGKISKPEYDWISYEIPENSTSKDLLSEHLKSLGLHATEDALVVLETRECVGENSSESSVFIRRMLHSAERLFTTQTSWSMRQRHYFEITRESHLAERLSSGMPLDSCGRCPGLERVTESLYKEANDALDTYAEVLVALRRVNQTSHVTQHSNPFDLESVLRDQLHHVISNCETLKDKRSKLRPRLLKHTSANNRNKAVAGRSKGVQSKQQEQVDEMTQLHSLGPSLLNTTINTSIKLYENEEKFLMSELKEISKKQEQSTSGPSLSEITSSLYSSLSVSGHATVVSAELTPTRQKRGISVDNSAEFDQRETGYNFKLSSLRNGGVTIGSQDTDSVLQEGDRVIEVNGHVVVTSNTDSVNRILLNSSNSSARVVVMRTETRDKVISSTMEAADLREDMRLIVNELQRESNRAKKLAQQKSQLIEAVRDIKKEKDNLEDRIVKLEEEKEELLERLEDVQSMLSDLTDAHRETCDHLADVTKEKLDLIDEIEKHQKELNKLKDHTERTEDALAALEAEYELMAENGQLQQPIRGRLAGKNGPMDANTYDQLVSVEKENLVQALQLNIEESTQQRAQLDSLLALVEQHAPQILDMDPSLKARNNERIVQSRPNSAIQSGQLAQNISNAQNYPNFESSNSNPNYETGPRNNNFQPLEENEQQFGASTVDAQRTRSVSSSRQFQMAEDFPALTNAVRPNNEFGFDSESEQEI